MTRFKMWLAYKLYCWADRLNYSLEPQYAAIVRFKQIKASKDRLKLLAGIRSDIKKHPPLQLVKELEESLRANQRDE